MTSLAADRIESELFRDEHRRIRPGLAYLSETVAELDRMSRVEVTERLTRILAWIRRDLVPHTTWEEAWLFPRLDQGAGSAWASRSLRLEHEQLRELGRRLDREFETVTERWNTSVAFGLAAALARLEAVMTAHLRNEEAVVIPLLEGAIVPEPGKP